MMYYVILGKKYKVGRWFIPFVKNSEGQDLAITTTASKALYWLTEWRLVNPDITYRCEVFTDSDLENNP